MNNVMKRILANIILPSSILLLALGMNHVEANEVAQANNPLGNFTAFGLQNYYTPDISDSDDDSNQLWLRFAKPVQAFDGNWLVRSSLPINSFSYPGSDGTETSIGDFNTFAAYLFDTGNPALSFGVGPLINVPTATEEELGSEKWSAGLVNILFDASSAKFQYGYLATWQHSFAGDDNREDINQLAFQPFAFYQLGDGVYLRSAPIWQYDFEHDHYLVPLSLGIGKVNKLSSVLVNTYIEPQVTLFDKGQWQAQWQVLAGITLQFR